VAAVLNTQRQGRVFVATLTRAPVNALNGELIDALETALDEADADSDVTLLHLRSEQRAFCAGADLALMQACFARPDGPDAMTALVRRMQQLFQRLQDASVVTLAEIGGAALGGGLELALACDLRVAAHEARLGLPEAGLGLIPGAGGTQRLTRLCGPGVASRLILGAEVVDGAEARRLGLVQWVCPREELAAFAAKRAAACAGSPKAALAAGKRCIAAASSPLRDGFAEELRETRALYEHPETRQAVGAFLARRANGSTVPV
jgi:enoyl-CoA hydratase/carnithine racemase